MERHFPIKPGQPTGMAFTIFIPFLNSLHDWTDLSQWNGKFRSDRSNWTTEYSGQKEPKQTFPYEFRPNFPEFLAYWKALLPNEASFGRQLTHSPIFHFTPSVFLGIPFFISSDNSLFVLGAGLDPWEWRVLSVITDWWGWYRRTD